jgi:hypothetical protein
VTMEEDVFDVDITPTGLQSGVLTLWMDSQIVAHMEVANLALCRLTTQHPELFQLLPQ